MNFEILRLTPENAAILDRVAVDVFDEPVNPKRVAAYLAQDGHLMLVALAEGEVVGQCAAVIHRHPDKWTELYIDEVGVAAGWRRQGLAREMLKQIFALGKSLGCEEVWVGTELDNDPALGLYNSFGGSSDKFAIYVFKL